MTRIVRIEDPQDPRIAPFRAVRERDLVGREGRFIAEGEVVVRLLARAPRHRPLALLLAEQRVAAQGELIEALAPDVAIYAAAQPVMDAIVGFPIHRGVLALGERATEPHPDALLSGLGEGAVVVAVCGVGNHDNIGGIFRNAAAFGADAVVLDSGCCDPLYRKAIRVSVGAALIVPTVRLAPQTDVVRLLQRHGFEALALSPSGDVSLSAYRRTGRTAMILGAEGPGLAPEVMARTTTVRIPMAAGFDSLNVAVTSGIVLHHLTGGA